jgi:hypothetical protein
MTALTYSCRLFLDPQDLTYARLKESVSYFGFNPRRCFQASSSGRNLIQLKQSIEEAVRSISPNVEISTIYAETYSSSGLSHSIFQLSPEDDMRLLGGARVGAVSMWALDLLLKKYESRQSDAAFNFYQSIKGMRTAATLRGKYDGETSIKDLDSLECPRTFEIRSLADSTISNWTYPGPIKRAPFNRHHSLHFFHLPLALEKLYIWCLWIQTFLPLIPSCMIHHRRCLPVFKSPSGMNTL